MKRLNNNKMEQIISDFNTNIRDFSKAINKIYDCYCRDIDEGEIGCSRTDVMIEVLEFMAESLGKETFDDITCTAPREHICNKLDARMERNWERVNEYVLNYISDGGYGRSDHDYDYTELYDKYNEKYNIDDEIKKKIKLYCINNDCGIDTIDKNDNLSEIIDSVFGECIEKDKKELKEKKAKKTEKAKETKNEEVKETKKQKVTKKKADKDEKEAKKK